MIFPLEKYQVLETDGSTQISSVVAFASALYSSSILEHDTTVCFFGTP